MYTLCRVCFGLLKMVVFVKVIWNVEKWLFEFLMDKLIASYLFLLNILFIKIMYDTLYACYTSATLNFNCFMYVCKVDIEVKYFYIFNNYQFNSFCFNSLNWRKIQCNHIKILFILVNFIAFKIQKNYFLNFRKFTDLILSTIYKKRPLFSLLV